MNSVNSDTTRMRLQAGSVSLFFDVTSLFLRKFVIGSTEVLRGVYLAVRDQNWGTLTPNVQVTSVENGGDSFRLEFVATVGEPEPVFEWKAYVTGTPDGEIRYVATGTALKELQTNRAGFCILHPASATGLPCIIEHSNGSLEKTSFPDEIMPSQPFFDVSSIVYEPTADLEVSVRMSDEVFETEDQRNWTDASFKTYCRPLSRPFPYTLRKGTSFTQEIVVSVKLHGATVVDSAVPRSEDSLCLELRSGYRRPGLGFLAMGDKRLSFSELACLDMLTPDHIRVDLAGSVDDQMKRLEQALDDVRQLGCRILATVELSDRSQAEELASAFSALDLDDLIDWLPLDADSSATHEDVFRAVSAAWETHRLNGKIGAGVRGNFAEFNRIRPVFEGVDFVVCSICPQVHAFDPLSIVETLSIQPLVVRQMQKLATVPVYASVVSFVQLFNPVATAETGEPHPDPRLHTKFGAAWTLGSLAAFTEGGASVVTMHAATGPHGVVASDNPTGSPLFRLFQELALYPSREWSVLYDSGETVPCGIAIHGEDRGIAFIGNLSDRERSVEIPGSFGRPVERKTLVGDDDGRALGELLPPWSVTRIEFRS